MRIVDNSKIF